MAAKIFRINYKSDFILTMNSEAGWTIPFCIKFWTSIPMRAYYVGFDGTTYTHCAYDPAEPTKLLVQFDDHHLPIGNLHFQIAYHFTVEDFPNNIEDEVFNATAITTEIDGETYQVMLDFTGETAPGIDFNMPSVGVTSVNGKIGAVTLNAEDVGAQPTIEDLATIRSGAAAGDTAVQPATLQEGLATKQNVIEDLATIRSGAAAGATAVQPATLQEGLATKQDTISDLATIRSGAAAGATAVQPAGLTPIQTALQTIEAVIPSAASAQNKLADKNFVNSSISTNTANFVGTFETLAELQAVQNPTNNDYGFVIETDAQGNEYYDRYKYVASSQQWLFEYKVESTPFTAAQWAAIQSGITSALVTKLNALPTAQQLSNQFAAKQDTISDLATIRSGAAAGATAYQKPGTGIPSTDLASAVQTSLERADEAAARPYNTQSPDGMGYLVLDKDATFASQVTTANTIYEIRYDYDLNGQTVTIPANCVLKFEGGKLSNGTIVGQETSITAGIVYIFSQVSFEGQWHIAEVYPEWFGAKGDFVVSVGYGTDDSQAFTAAIRAANQLNVNKVTLSSAMYSITHGIEITDGNILIQGTYANLREDQNFSYNTNVKIGLGSSLVSYKADYIFKVTSTATHPVDFENVNFYNFRSLRDDEKPRAIQFSSEFGGPLSPIIINKCYFRGFDICIFSSSELAYNLSSVQVTQCSFILNQHCVYFAYNEGSPLRTNYSYTFTFEDNKAHQNAYILTLSILFGNAWIRRNNLEGPKTPDLYGNTPGSICSTIRMASGANIVVEDNYAEQMNGRVLMGFEVFKPTVSTNLLPNRCHLTYRNNRHFETDNKFFYLASKGTQDTISNYLAKEFQLEVLSDAPFRVFGYLHLFLKDGCNEDIQLLDSSCLWLHTNKKLGSQATTMQLESDYNYLASCDASITAGTPTMKVIGDKLYIQRGNGVPYIASRISLAETSVRYIIAGARCTSTLPLDNQSVLFFDDSSYFSGVPIVAAKGYDWCYAIRRTDNFDNSRLYVAYYIANTATFISTIELWSLSTSTLTFNNLNQAEKYNATLSAYLPSISDAPEGMILYLSDLKKSVVWNGTAWVNMDGTALT